MEGKRYFDEYEVDPIAGVLLRDGQAVRLTPKTFGLLLHFLERPGALVSREELFERHWHSQVVTDDALARCIRELRGALDDDAREPRYLATLHRRGYRFVATVRDDGADPDEHRRRDTEVFVGRSAVLADLEASIAGARRSSVGLVLEITGEPGVGKSRLLRELARIGGGHGFRVVTAFAAEAKGAPPFWLWMQVLAAIRDKAPTDTIDARLAVLREGNRHTTETPPALASERFDIRQLVIRHLAGFAQNTPLLLQFEDLHAAEADCLQLLAELARQTTNLPIVVALSYRDVGAPPNPALIDMLAELARSTSRLERVALRGLDDIALAQWLHTAVGAPASAEWVRSTMARTAGNPLYVRELLALPSFASSLRYAATAADDDARDADASASDTPETVHQLLLRRLALLDDATLGCLRMAAVIGKEFGVDPLARALALDELEVRAALHAARSERLLREAHGQWFFSHGLVREVLYDALPAEQRATMHLRAARALEQINDATNAVPFAQLAWHFGLAQRDGDWAMRLARYLELAAADAHEAFAYQEAAAHCERLVAHRERQLGTDRIGLSTAYVRRAQAQSLCGVPAEARRLANHALTIARDSQQPAAIALATLALVALQPAYPPQPALIDLLTAALEGLSAEHLALRARLLAQRAFQHYVQSHLAELRSDARAAERAARDSGDPHALEEALSALGYSLIEPADDRERRAVYDERFAMARRANDLRGEYAAQFSRLEHVMQIGPTAAAVDIEVAHFEHLAQLIDSPSTRAAQLRVQSGLVGGRGDPERALQLAKEAVQVGQSTTDLGTVHAFRLLHYGAWLDWLGRQHEVYGDVQHDVVVNHNSLMRASLILVRWRLGDRDGARNALDELIASNLELTHDMAFGLALGNLALSICHLEHRRAAEWAYQRLLPYRGRNLTALAYFSGGCASHYLALLAGTMGRWPECELLLAEALDVNERMGLRLQAVDTAYAYRQVLRRLDKVDRDLDARLRACVEQLPQCGVRIESLPSFTVFR